MVSANAEIQKNERKKRRKKNCSPWVDGVEIDIKQGSDDLTIVEGRC